MTAPPGGRSALARAGAHRFRELRGDVNLDVRSIELALRRLRAFVREGALTELDVEATIDKTASNAGELEIVMRPERRPDVKVLLLIDVGGSMDPHVAGLRAPVLGGQARHALEAARHLLLPQLPLRPRLPDDVAAKRHRDSAIARRARPVVEADRRRRRAHASVGAVADRRLGRPGLRQRRPRPRLARHGGAPLPQDGVAQPRARVASGAAPRRRIGNLFPMFRLSLDGLAQAVRAPHAWQENA